MPVSSNGKPEIAERANVTQWREAHEVESLLDTLSIYRRCVVDLAAENTRLRDEVSILRAMARGT